jgi:hypothetical protein
VESVQSQSPLLSEPHNSTWTHSLIRFIVTEQQFHGLTAVSIVFSFFFLFLLLLVRSKLEYVSVVWNSITSTDANKLERIQQRSAALCVNHFFPEVHYCYSLAVEELKLRTLRIRRHRLDSLFLAQVYFGLKFESNESNWKGGGGLSVRLGETLRTQRGWKHVRDIPHRLATRIDLRVLQSPHHLHVRACEAKTKKKKKKHGFWK